jgi:hypothetical protein
MEDGLYKVHFVTAAREGFGVAYLSHSKIWGGDSLMFYTGSFIETDGLATVAVEAKVHSKIPGLNTVFGLDHVHIYMQGSATASSARLSGAAKEAPEITFKLSLTKLAD